MSLLSTPPRRITDPAPADRPSPLALLDPSTAVDGSTGRPVTTAAVPGRGRTIAHSAVAAGIAVIGLIVAGTSAAWVAGSLGISAAAATQIVAAIEVGGVALTVVGAVFGAGIGGALAATVRGMLLSQSRKVVVA
ncbi:hypothetical protein [Mycetocola reblochoni]|uniref:Uncharacterized protein n=2 Tax=Mycetocola reblochoni TaxID=331618 RepID=A0A1R4KBF5_9MICO|nr:hypothetical protein [Mycetocola reblochoni]RLP69228.1 hypothetical protein D9V30_07900 [Mycetocola reblochoni]SJN41484.1 hypothetical protein FM119_12655 [Mycetocola reblochoni REB411]